MPITNHKIKRSRLILSIVGILAFCIFAYFYAHVERSTVNYTKNQNAVSTTGEIDQSVTIEQAFVADKEGFCGISLLFGTYDRSNTSSIAISILDEQSQNVYQKEINTADLKDNAEYRLDFSPMTQSSGKSFLLVISTPDAKEGNAIAIYTYPDTEGNKAYLRNKNTTADVLALKTYYQYFDYQTIIVLVYFALVIIAFITYIYKYI
ncbi:MAG: hypothetical protein VB070_01535 [Clostridiaceae bacterium]|nr:hypothetical protein [Clostridiaceae bacterium]